MDLMKNYNKVKYNNSMQRPHMVSWDITNKCNMRCRHCYNSSGDTSKHNFSNELSREKVLDIAHQIADMHPTQCCLCGGETLLNENIYDIIKIISNSNVAVNIVSNGLLLNKNVAKRLKDSGVFKVQISVDGLGYQHDIFRNMQGSFKKAINALMCLMEEDIGTMVSCCPNKLNYKTFENYVKYITSLGCSTIRMMPLIPMGRGNQFCNDLLLSNMETFDFVYRLSALKEEYPMVNFEWGDPLEHLFIVLLSKRKYPIVMNISSIGDL